MFTIKDYTDVVQKDKRRRSVTVNFINGGETVGQEFSFSLDTPIETIKKTVTAFLNELNFVPPAIDNWTPPQEPTPTEPTQVELDRTAWEADFAKLEKVKRLIDTGVLTGDEAQVVTLRNKVKANFKPAYL